MIFSRSSLSRAAGTERIRAWPPFTVNSVPPACGRRAKGNALPPTLLAFAALLAGCSRYSPDAHAVDPEAARQTLAIALTSWKNRAAPDSLRSQSPAITVQDPDWEAGYRLLDFKVLGPGTKANANLRCSVELVLQDREGRQQRKQVKYMVGTSPVRTVFREVFHDD